MWIWGYILTAIVAAIGAIITWFIADFIAGLIARPLLHFFELRSKVAEGLAEFDNVLPPGRWEHGVIELVDLPADEDARLKEAQKTFRKDWRPDASASAYCRLDCQDWLEVRRN